MEEIQVTTRWQLKKKYVFVENYDLDNLDPDSPQHRHPVGSAFIMLRDVKPHHFIKMDNIAAFIMRFVIMGVDTQLYLPDIVASEYNDMTRAAADTRIKSVVVQMAKYLDPCNRKRNIIPEKYEEGDYPVDEYPLDNSMRSIGPGFIKGPF
jgi:hypothetical protein